MLFDPNRPAATPAMVAELADHLRLPVGFADAADHAAPLGRCLDVGLRVVEERTRRALLARAMVLRVSAWDEAGRARLPLAPVTAIEAVEVADADGARAATDPAAWRIEVDGERVWASPRAGRRPPAIPRDGFAEVRFVAGHGPELADAPQDLRHAAILIAADCWERRTAGAAPTPPAAALALLAPWRPVRL